MIVSVRVPFAPGVFVDEAAAEGVKGQFTTVLFGGHAILGAVRDAKVMGDLGNQTLWMELEADEFPGLPDLVIPEPEVTGPPAEVVLDWSHAEVEPDVPR